MYRLDGAMDPPMIRVDAFLLKLWFVVVVLFGTLPLLRRDCVGVVEVLVVVGTTAARKYTLAVARRRKKKMWCIMIGIHYEHHMQCNDDCILSRLHPQPRSCVTLNPHRHVGQKLWAQHSQKDCAGAILREQKPKTRARL